MHRESLSRQRQRGGGEECRAEIRFLCAHSPSFPALLPPAGEGSVRMSLFSSIFVANYGKLNNGTGSIFCFKNISTQHHDAAPERVFRAVQNSWYPSDWREDGGWLRVVRNARRGGG